MSDRNALPDPPYYAVIFTSVRTPTGNAEYGAMAAKMEELARRQPGFLGIESAREEIGITVSYWRDEAALKAWKRDLDHIDAQRRGRTEWYAGYTVRIARVERAYGFGDAIGAEPPAG